jgi:cation diffusion facilitator CzcD-associated flavoprotein CzcO
MDSERLDFDAIVIGAGLSGLYQLYRLRELGMSVRLLEEGGGVGGTWYWNRYPGARLDSESYTVSYSFDKDFLREWSWSELFAAQPELEAYYNRFADRFDLRKDISLNTMVTGAKFDSAENTWQVSTNTGESFRCRFLVATVGFLSVPSYPREPGLDLYEGEAYHTARWPKDPVDFDGKRVAVVGTGASGVQIIQTIAHQVAFLSVFQRHANYVFPLRNRPLSPSEQSEFSQHFERVIAACMANPGGFVHERNTRFALEATPEERRETYEHIWALPGWAKVSGTFADTMVSPEANRYYSEFAREKFRERVDDPQVADRLVPSDHGIITRRPPTETAYFEVFNRSNVELVDLKESPIERFTATGIATSDGIHRDFDMIVLATGFDAYTGAYGRIDIQADGLRLAEKWAEGPKSFLGLMVAGFPNFFMCVGVHNKGGAGNVPRISELNVNFITRCIDYARKFGFSRIEAAEEAEAEFTQHVLDRVNKTLLPTAAAMNPTFYGTNIPRKPRVFYGYAGTLQEYLARCGECEDGGYKGLYFT